MKILFQIRPMRSHPFDHIRGPEKPYVVKFVRTIRKGHYESVRVFPFSACMSLASCQTVVKKHAKHPVHWYVDEYRADCPYNITDLTEGK